MRRVIGTVFVVNAGWEPRAKKVVFEVVFGWVEIAEFLGLQDGLEVGLALLDGLYLCMSGWPRLDHIVQLSLLTREIKRVVEGYMRRGFGQLSSAAILLGLATALTHNHSPWRWPAKRHTLVNNDLRQLALLCYGKVVVVLGWISS